MFKVNCEWDLGLNDCIFASRELAMKYIRSAWGDAGFDEDFTVEAAMEDWYLSIEELEVISE